MSKRLDQNIDQIAKRMKEQREKEKLSFQDLADRTGLSKSTLQRYETGGIKNIPLDKLQVLSDGLNCSREYLLGWDRPIDSWDESVLKQYPGFIPGKNHLPTEEDDTEIHTIAAHAIGELNDEDIEEIIRLAKHLKSKYKD